MSWFDRQLAKVFPTYALKRAVAQRRLRRLDALSEIISNRRSFEAVSGDRMRYDILINQRSPDSAIKGDISKLREHVRHLSYNNGFVSGPVKRIANNVVGQGIKPQAIVSADEGSKRTDKLGMLPKINQAIAESYNESVEWYFNKIWAKKSDVRLISNFWEQQSLAEMALINDGESIIIGRNSKRKDRLIPYCLEVVECDRLQTPSEELQNPKIRNGIEYDDEGVPEYYWILKEHPGESYDLSIRSDAFERIKAFNSNGTKKIIHLFNPLRPEQSRGFSQFASGLKDLQDLDRYREAELFAALEDACLTGFVKTANPTGFQAAYTEASGDANYDRIHEFAPNKWHYLRPGEDIQIHAPSRPNDAFGEFTNQLLRGPANALDIPPEVMSQNWKDMNYSNARTVLLQFYASCVMRQAYLIWHLCQPVYENVVVDLFVKGLIKAPNFERRKDSYMSSIWIPTVYRKWVDPQKEATGKQIELNCNLETVTDICAESGKDGEEHLEKRARELRKIKDLEEKYDVKFPGSNDIKPKVEKQDGKE